MMAKKGFNKILIFGVILIWLFVIRKAFNFLSSEDNNVPMAKNVDLADMTILEFKKDTFNIDGYDRDPFLDTFRKNRVVVKKKTKEPKKAIKKVIKKKEAPKILWPKLQYFGYIKGKDKTGKLALIKINSKLHRVREKQEINGIQIKKVFKDSVILKLNNELKAIKK